MKALYLTYDGITDNLGQSQILPYLKGLAEAGHEIEIISAEKKDAFERREEKIKESLSGFNIGWHPLIYHKKPPVLSTVYDASMMRMKMLSLHEKLKFDLVHCRSYVTSMLGLSLHEKYGVPFLFDMRGLWADERVDGGLWNLKNPIYHSVYRYFKWMESRFVKESAHIVSLTHAGAKEIETLYPNSDPAKKMSVIPCSCDSGLFDPEKISSHESLELRKKLRIADSAPVIGYVGSIGTWYLLDEMLLYFKGVLESSPDAVFLFITPETPELILNATARLGIPCSSVVVTRSDREKVPLHLSLLDVGLSFIKPSYSKISSSPTKLGEMLSMGIPVVSNAKVGDAEFLYSKYRIGMMIPDVLKETLLQSGRNYRNLLELDKSMIRACALEYFSLEGAQRAYVSIYMGLAV